MSTVSKAIADRVIAGEFPEDCVVAIIRYENIFNGDYAYKLVFHVEEIQRILDGAYPALLDPTIYWKSETV